MSPPPKTRYINRPIPQISLHDFPTRIDEITTELIHACESIGFFSITNHGISLREIESMFALSESFFALPDDQKASVAWTPDNVGWEKKSQIRPSTGAPDMKESYQLQFGENMVGKWASDDLLPGFEARCLEFMHRCQEVSEKLMVCFARGLGFEDDYFVRVHDVSRPNIQSVARLLHYFATPEPKANEEEREIWHRAGAHADWAFLTLLFQKEGQSGLEICPGRDSVTDFALGDAWTKVELGPTDIICNIGDLLMSWSDDRFKSTFHRVKAPCEPGDYYGERYSIAFFNQPCKDAIVQGPLKKYPAVTGTEFTANAMKRNFKALEEKRREMAEVEMERQKQMKEQDKSMPTVPAAA